MGYYDPTHTIDLSYADYEFDILGVDIREDGIYLGTDSGCSCPMPWENHTKDDFTGPLTVEQAREEAMSLWENTNDSHYASRADKDDFEAALDEALSTQYTGKEN